MQTFRTLQLANKRKTIFLLIFLEEMRYKLIVINLAFCNQKIKAPKNIEINEEKKKKAAFATTCQENPKIQMPKMFSAKTNSQMINTTMVHMTTTC